MLDGCTLSNSLVVGVHNIPKHRLLLELQMRCIPVPPRGIAPSTQRACLHLMGKASIGAHVAKYFNVQGRGNTLLLGSVLAFRDGNHGGTYTGNIWTRASSQYNTQMATGNIWTRASSQSHTILQRMRNNEKELTF
jgi:hypothetical protein